MALECKVRWQSPEKRLEEPFPNHPCPPLVHSMSNEGFLELFPAWCFPHSPAKPKARHCHSSALLVGLQGLPGAKGQWLQAPSDGATAQFTLSRRVFISQPMEIHQWHQEEYKNPPPRSWQTW